MRGAAVAEEAVGVGVGVEAERLTGQECVATRPDDR